MKVGLYFGSFNPIHIGHLIIANTIVEATKLTEVWFVVSPQNPFKPRKSLLHEFDRLDLVRLAIGDNYHLRASDIEFSLPKPSYTVDTLAHLYDKYPQHQFSLIMGEDNLVHFHKWKNSGQILEHHDLIVYPRPGIGEVGEMKNHPRVQYVKAPLLEISATYIRDQIKNGHSVQYLLPDAVVDRIRGSKFYH
ncbi:MAG TPA: nicotinic acid mononucleotide adenylyltransferase [Cytophagales bacterium]|nr:nicotinic acid mononucleotide adenylyltransferase [Cytophagales bacterium]HAA17383.1 nicotinic acid mononucleotide adenylyltransferase [Cytophagales bacterium]HAP61747.1 nicotinic acid mononucleotide adenylyltransferase [Cytophagales bacterium]